MNSRRRFLHGSALLLAATAAAARSRRALAAGVEQGPEPGVPGAAAFDGRARGDDDTLHPSRRARRHAMPGGTDRMTASS